MFKPKPIVPAITAMILTIAGATAAYAAPAGARSASPGPTVNLAAAAKGCAVLHVALHGTKAPTITCLRRTRPTVQAGHAGQASYRSIGTLDCEDPNVNLVIDTYTGTICYTGTGYLGLSPSIPEVVSISADYRSWVRLYYNDIGSFFNMRDGGVDEWFLGPGGFNAGPMNVYITQIDDNQGYHN